MSPSNITTNLFLPSKTLVVGCLLAASGLSAAAVINGEVEKLKASPTIEATILNTSKGGAQWYSYSVAMEPHNGMPCCLISEGATFCDLDNRSTSWSVQDSDDQNSAALEILFKAENGETSDLILAGDACQIRAGEQRIFRFDNISEKASLGFLERLTNHSNSGLASKATAAIALHKGALAQSMLESHINSAESETRRNGIFWLGEARNQAGYRALLRVISDAGRSEDERAHAVFALSLNKYSESKDALSKIALTSPNTRLQGEAVFWLAQHHKSEAEPVIQDILDSAKETKLKKKAVFALAQIKTDSSWSELTRLAESSKDQEVKLEAIFWLSQDQSRDPSAILLTLADGAQPRAVQDKAVFALSQLKRELATPALIGLSKSATSRFVKKQVLFWLGQSNDPRALDYLEQLLTSS